MSSEPTVEPSPEQTLYLTLMQHTHVLEEAVKRKDRNKLSSVSKHNAALRRGLSTRVFHAVLDSLELRDRAYGAVKSDVNSVLGEVSEVEMVGQGGEIQGVGSDVHVYVHEVEVYVRLLVVYFLVDKQQWELARRVVTGLVDWVERENRRTLDLFSAKVYFYYSLVHERMGKLAEIRPRLFALHRSACLRHDEPGQAALINLILRNLLQDNLIHQADQFMLNSPFPENHSNYQYARYLYYAGRINVVQLNYSEAYQNLSQVVRRAPQERANGFREHVTFLNNYIFELTLFRLTSFWSLYSY
jgi:26S proteasome regulatory subunit N3